MITISQQNHFDKKASVFIFLALLYGSVLTKKLLKVMDDVYNDGGGGSDDGDADNDGGGREDAGDGDYCDDGGDSGN